jgi:N-acetylglucosaminyl-diphospho-decaprenol L-rhamnosyltransferase
LTSVAIAVVSWNTRDLLGRALESIAPAVEEGLAEAWVVDNASEDGSAALVADAFPWARLIALNENIGFGRAVNLVAERTDTDWIAPANADIALEPGTLETLLDAGARHQRAGAIAPMLILPGGETQHSVYPFPTLRLTVLFNLGLHRLVEDIGDRLCLEGFWDPERRRWVDWAVGAFLLVRRRAWLDTGGFDPRHWLYAEDLDLGWRLRAAGWRTLYEPGAKVRHEVSASTGPAFAGAQTARWTRSTYAWMLRTWGAPATRSIAVINLLGAAVRWYWFALAARISPRRWQGQQDAMRCWTRMHLIGLEPARSLAQPRWFDRAA